MVSFRRRSVSGTHRHRLRPGQLHNFNSKAAPPDKAALTRLNLKTEWSLYLPVEGHRDGLTQVQTIGDQVFVQTRAGMLIAVDARTGRTQWAARLGTGADGNAYPVAANSRFVFCAHVTKLYAFYRYTGVTEFVAELGSPPTTGLAADEDAVYAVLGVRAGSGGAHRIAVYDMPPPISINVAGKGTLDPLGQGASSTATSSVDDLLGRYSPGTNIGSGSQSDDREVYAPVRPDVLQVPPGSATGGRTPSVSTLPSVVPPYSLGNRAPSPSLGILPSLRYPYHLRLESGRYIQQTPSLGVIPPSVAASLLLADLRPKSVGPKVRWEYALTSRILYPLTQTSTRVWTVTEGNFVLAVNKLSRVGKVVTEVKEQLNSPIAAAPVQAGTMNYIPLGNGTLLAVDATSGNLDGGLNIKWRANPGGVNNHSPFITAKFVYAAGDDGGVTCINRANGDVIWRSAENADRVIGANNEFVYIRDRQGRFLVFAAGRATDPARKKSVPLGTANFSEFNVHVVNTASDRIYLAANNGLLVCLRDLSPKYAKPVVIWPVSVVNPPPRETVIGGGANPPPPKKMP